MSDTMREAFIALAAQSAACKIDRAGIGEAEIVKMTESMIPNLPDTAGQIAAFKADVGDEVFGVLAAGQSLMSAVAEWRKNIAERNLEKFTVMLKEKVPDISDDELKSLLYLTMEQNK